MEQKVAQADVHTCSPKTDGSLGTEGDGKPLPALAGGQWVPAWTTRPGAYPVLHSVADAIPLWTAIHTRSGDHWWPCYATRETLAATLVVSVRTVATRLRQLREGVRVLRGQRVVTVPLILEIDEGRDRATGKHLPPLRWALDPMEVDRWRPKIEERLRWFREARGHDGRWLSRALQELSSASMRCSLLARGLQASLPITLRRKKRKRRPRAKSARRPRANAARQGMGGAREVGRGTAVAGAEARRGTAGGAGAVGTRLRSAVDPGSLDGAEVANGRRPDLHAVTRAHTPTGPAAAEAENDEALPAGASEEVL